MNAKPKPLALPRPASKTRDLRFTVRIRARPEQVYRALTSATELCRWWLQAAETDARSAGRFRMVWPRVRNPDSSSRNGRAERGFPPHVAVGDSEGYFVDLEPGRKVAWMWNLPRRKLFPPLSSFFIQKKRGGCEVTLLHAGFPNKRAADKYFQGCVQGWEDCLAKLKLYLETGRTCKAQALTFKGLKALLKTK